MLKTRCNIKSLSTTNLFSQPSWKSLPASFHNCTVCFQINGCVYYCYVGKGYLFYILQEDFFLPMQTVLFFCFFKQSDICQPKKRKTFDIHLWLRAVFCEGFAPGKEWTESFRGIQNDIMEKYWYVKCHYSAKKNRDITFSPYSPAFVKPTVLFDPSLPCCH